MAVLTTPNKSYEFPEWDITLRNSNDYLKNTIFAIDTDIFNIETILATKTSIDDANVSTTTTYSSDKIVTELLKIIDDTTPSDISTYSSNKIISEIYALIDDTAQATDKTYSSSKIESLVVSTTSALIDDANVSTTTTYSSDNIVTFVNDSVSALIDDATISTTKVFSSSYVDSTYLKISEQYVSGASASRPTTSTVGYMYFDTDLGKPIWFNGTDWVDATGTVV